MVAGKRVDTANWGRIIVSAREIKRLWVSYVPKQDATGSATS